eukprot:scaffold420068_cov25-Prasinocladus_malaysianus.AAC.1
MAEGSKSSNRLLTLLSAGGRPLPAQGPPPGPQRGPWPPRPRSQSPWPSRSVHRIHADCIISQKPLAGTTKRMHAD